MRANIVFLDMLKPLGWHFTVRIHSTHEREIESIGESSWKKMREVLREREQLLRIDPYIQIIAYNEDSQVRLNQNKMLYAHYPDEGYEPFIDIVIKRKIPLVPDVPANIYIPQITNDVRKSCFENFQNIARILGLREQ